MHKLLPIATSFIFISSSLSCMEISKDNSQQLLAIHHQQITLLYEKTYTTLNHYSAQESPADKTIFCNKIDNIFEIINDTNTLKKNGLSEHTIGQFAYNQEQPWREKMGIFPYGKFYVSVFYDRLQRYHENLQKNEFSHPTPKNYHDHIANKKMKANRWATAQSAEKFGIYIDEKEIERANSQFELLPHSIAIKDFETLLQHIQLIKTEKPEIIKTLADMLYNDLLKKETK